MLNEFVSGKLSNEEIGLLFKDMMSGKLSDVKIASFLTALSVRKSKPDELISFLKIIRENSVKIDLKPGFLVDTCGTGGDNSGSFNVSTTAMFVISGAGIRVAKHGNRSSSSKCGSAAVLEELGVKINLGPSRAKEIIEKIGLVFLFAPLYHPSFRHVSSVRKELGFKTIFNFLGPLCNPASVKRQVIGVYDPALTEVVIHILKEAGSKHALAVHGNGLDEFTINGKNKVTELKNGEIKTYYLDAKDFGLLGSLKDIKGGSPEINKKIILDVLKGKKGACRNIVLFNSGAAIYVSGKANSIKEGIALAKKSIDSGVALKKLQLLVEETNK